MIKYTNSLENITLEQLKGFFKGWKNPPTPQVHLKLLKGSYRVVLALDEQTRNVIGFITAISDDTSSAYIPFLEVLPEYQNQGIGSELMRRMLAELEEFYMIDLLCDEELVKFYEDFGMKKCTGMMIRNYDKQSGK